MASVERRHGAGGISSDEEHCMYNRNVEDDSKTKKSKRRQKINILSSAGLAYLISDCKVNPTRASKRLVSKFFIYFWCIAVVLSILSLLGVRISPFSSSSQVRAVKTSKRRLTADLEEGDGELSVDAISDAVEATSSSDSSLWSSVLGDILSSTDDTGDAEEKSPDADKDDEIPVQLMAIPVKEGNKLNKKLERELACVELTCVDDCNKKIKPKCAKSKTCRNDRDKICKRRCRKARCEERCKDEPKFGYVEREQRMDKCKEECTGPTAAHNKCIKKCHSQFKPCKSRCHEIASKYPCDNPPVTEPPQDIEDEPEAMSTPAETTSSISSTTQELIEDPEMI